MTLVDLCNDALDLVGASSISSLADGSPEARLVARLHGPVIDRVLRAYPWNSAQIRTVLTPLATAPQWGFSLAFELPSAPFYCLRVLSVGSENHQPLWKVESLYDSGVLKRVIVTDAQAPLPVLYLRRILDPDEMDALLVDVIVHELAVRLAAKLTESATRIERLSALARTRYLNAIQVDAREQGTMAYTETQSWLEAWSSEASA